MNAELSVSVNVDDDGIYEMMTWTKMILVSRHHLQHLSTHWSSSASLGLVPSTSIRWPHCRIFRPVDESQPFCHNSLQKGSNQANIPVYVDKRKLITRCHTKKLLKMKKTNIYIDIYMRESDKPYKGIIIWVNFLHLITDNGVFWATEHRPTETAIPQTTTYTCTRLLLLTMIWQVKITGIHATWEYRF